MSKDTSVYFRSDSSGTRSGFVLQWTCDIDECADRSHNCHLYATCTNLQNGFECKCNTGYSGNGTNCESTGTLVDYTILVIKTEWKKT